MTGLAFLPFPIIMGLTSSQVSRFVTRYGFKRFLLIGPLIAAGALAWLSRVPVAGSYWVDVFPAVVLMPRMTIWSRLPSPWWITTPGT